MHFEYLPTEIVTNVLQHCTSLDDLCSLASTCRRFRKIYNGPGKLRFLEQAINCQYGPFEDAVQLITHNASQPAHLIRTVPVSMAVLKQIVHVGKIAEQWCRLYPFKKWKYNYEDRRLLSAEEHFRLRRAMYRLWLFTKAFHNEAFRREHRMTLANMQARAELLHNWNTQEIMEIVDVRGIMRDVVTVNVCPSNGTIARKFRKRYEGTEYAHHQLMFNIHLNYPPQPNPASAPPQPLSDYHCPPPVIRPSYEPPQYYNSPTIYNAKFRTHQRFAFTPTHEPGGEGWGDDFEHYYVVEDMLKLDPEQILWLKDHAPLRMQVEAYTRGLGDWFDNNGETWAQTFEWVMRERGEDIIGLIDALSKEEVGVAVRDD